MKKLLLILALLLVSMPTFAKNISLNYDDGIYFVKLKGNSVKKQIQFVTCDKLTTNKDVHRCNDSLLTINTGFFDPVKGSTISYITTDFKITADPSKNTDLINNKDLQPNLDKILNRSEFRILKRKNKYIYEIARHNDPIKKGYNVVTSAQGGPRILPEMNLEDEFFIVKDSNDKVVRESASVLRKTARTVIGIKNKKTAYILIITNNNPKTMEEAKDLCKKLKLKSAMAFDGGTSTSICYNDFSYVASYSLKGRLLKSFMIIKK